MTDVNIAITAGVGADTYIESHLNGNVNKYNFGTAVSFYTRVSATYGRKSLLRFDLAGIASSATISSATLKLTTIAAINASKNYNLYKISDANGDWVEGTKDGTTAGAGEPCWDAKVADGSGGVTTAWAGSAGLATAGTDYVDTVIATVGTGAGVAENTLFEIPFNAAGLVVLQSWFGDATNNGMLLYSDDTGYGRFHSGEAITESYRPVLSITYTEAVTGTLLKVNMNAQMQNLSGGIHG